MDRTREPSRYYSQTSWKQVLFQLFRRICHFNVNTFTLKTDLASVLYNDAHETSLTALKAGFGATRVFPWSFTTHFKGRFSESGRLSEKRTAFKLEESRSAGAVIHFLNTMFPRPGLSRRPTPGKTTYEKAILLRPLTYILENMFRLLDLCKRKGRS
jgi:hypothetical protein